MDRATTKAPCILERLMTNAAQRVSKEPVLRLTGETEGRKALPTTSPSVWFCRHAQGKTEGTCLVLGAGVGLSRERDEAESQKSRQGASCCTAGTHSVCCCACVVCKHRSRVRERGHFLVDPASSHMLRSRAKPCMSQCTRIESGSVNGSLHQQSSL